MRHAASAAQSGWFVHAAFVSQQCSSRHFVQGSEDVEAEHCWFRIGDAASGWFPHAAQDAPAPDCRHVVYAVSSAVPSPVPAGQAPAQLSSTLPVASSGQASTHDRYAAQLGSPPHAVRSVLQLVATQDPQSLVPNVAGVAASAAASDLARPST